ncbi:MAG TPA: hypothetical protein PK198_25605, partial [Saprospiraceae bacterium]|nr:hypothetical protein [Saprospiraceae bacterium]
MMINFDFCIVVFFGIATTGNAKGSVFSKKTKAAQNLHSERPSSYFKLRENYFCSSLFSSVAAASVAS